MTVFVVASAAGYVVKLIVRKLSCFGVQQLKVLLCAFFGQFFAVFFGESDGLRNDFSFRFAVV